MRSDWCQLQINGASSSSGHRERLVVVRDCKLRSMKLRIRHSDKYGEAARELRADSSLQLGAMTKNKLAGATEPASFHHHQKHPDREDRNTYLWF